MFIGREKELSSLKELLDKPIASLVSCRGRRRIGKSTLFREFSKRNKTAFIVIEGLGPRKGQTNFDQLKNFGESLCAQTSGPRVIPESWNAAFRLLGERLDKTRKTVVLLDEISWMGSREPDFPGMLKNGWDDELKQHSNLILVVCGSVSAWIQKNLLESSTFGGRFSRSIILKELSPSECIQFWHGKEKRLAPREIIDVLSVTGGVPRYLEEISPSLSADENIRRMCFREDGPLFKDFSSIFSDTFGSASTAKGEILRILSKSAMTCSEIAKQLGIERGGNITQNLKELGEAGFICEDAYINPATGRKARQNAYRICDNYTRFYLKYIEPHEANIRNGHFMFESLDSLPEWPVIMGLQFENLVINNLQSLLPFLNAAGRQIDSAAPYFQRATQSRPGMQIDLLIQAGRTAYIVEIKHRRNIGSELIAEIEDKVKNFPKRNGISVRTALVYEGELSQSVIRSGVFDYIVPFKNILGI